MIYAISSSKESLDIITGKIIQLEYPLYRNTQGHLDTLFVACDRTSQELSNDIGVGGDDIGVLLVLGVSSYYGYASKYLWEWLDAHGNS